MAALVRRPDGAWDDLYGLDESGTRPVMLLDEANGVLTFVYTQSEGNNPIVYRQSPLEPIAFGSKKTLQGAAYNDVSGAKQNYTGELVTIFSNGSVVAGEICRPAGAAPKPPVVSVAKDGNNVKLTWPQVTQDVDNHATTVLRYQAYRSLKPYFRPGDDSSALPDQQVTGLEYIRAGAIPLPDGEYFIVRAANAVGPSADSRRTGKFTYPLAAGSDALKRLTACAGRRSSRHVTCPNQVPDVEENNQCRFATHPPCCVRSF